MVRKRTLKSTDNGQTSSRPKRHKRTEKEPEKAVENSSFFNGEFVNRTARMFELNVAAT